jgi:NAD(P)-dependent dehydrogenase (short-subunit alcohol dehydrogenase family)
LTRELRLTEQDLERFAEASGDRNPLHLSEVFARRTPYGRCICHGALVTIAALGSVGPDELRHVQGLNVQFKQPVFPQESYAVRLLDSQGGMTRVEVSGRGRVAAIIDVTADPAEAPLPAASDQSAAGDASPQRYAFEEAAAIDRLEREYGCRLDELSTLARDVGASHVPDAILVWLAAASYTVGMLIPGEDALFAGGRLIRASRPASGTLTATVTGADDRTGLLLVDVDLNQGEAGATMSLQTFLRVRVPAPDQSSIARYLAPSRELAGRNVLVVGASRGLGAALSGALATQAATVWAGFARSGEQAADLKREFGDDRVRLLPFNAQDNEDTGRALDTIRAETETLDGIALCAAPPLYETALTPDASESTLQLVSSSLALALFPLAQALQILSPNGWIVVVSSSALDELPEPWPQYVVAKAALEGLAAYCAQHVDARVLVVRPPRMWTDSMNTPLGRIGAAATAEVAEAIVRWVIEAPDESGVSLLTPKQLLQASGSEVAQA